MRQHTSIGVGREGYAYVYAYVYAYAWRVEDGTVHVYTLYPLIAHTVPACHVIGEKRGCKQVCTHFIDSTQVTNNCSRLHSFVSPPDGSPALFIHDCTGTVGDSCIGSSC